VDLASERIGVTLRATDENVVNNMFELIDELSSSVASRQRRGRATVAPIVSDQSHDTVKV
jgi:hypothetical protein